MSYSRWWWREDEAKLEASRIADDHYAIAERFYQKGDFEKAELESKKAMWLQPGHRDASALHIEIQFISY